MVTQVFNSRNNRGVHAAGSHKTGGVITGVSKEKLGALDKWAEVMGAQVLGALRTYFKPCNKELAALLGPDEQMSWA